MSFQASGLPPGGLVLSRGESEEIVIEVGGRVVAVVQVAALQADRAKLRLRAPADVVIARAEVYRRPKHHAVPA